MPFKYLIKYGSIFVFLLAEGGLNGIRTIHFLPHSKLTGRLMLTMKSDITMSTIFVHVYMQPHLNGAEWRQVWFMNKLQWPEHKQMQPAVSSYCDATKWNSPLRHSTTAALAAGQVQTGRSPSSGVDPETVETRTRTLVLLRDRPWRPWHMNCAKGCQNLKASSDKIITQRSRFSK
jgi:hypothetical protein